MTKKNKIAATLLIFLCISCTHKLLMPLKKGKVQVQKDYSFIIYPQTDFNVRAVENCKIINIVRIDSMFGVFASGKYNVSYLNVAECLVKINDSIPRGYVLGRLTQITKLNENYLMLDIRSSQNETLTNTLFK